QAVTSPADEAAASNSGAHADERSKEEARAPRGRDGDEAARPGSALDDIENPLSRPTPLVGVAAEQHDVGPSPYRVWKWTAGGAAVVAAGAGVLFLLRAGEQQDVLRHAAAPLGMDPMNRFDGELRAIEDGYEANRTWATVAFIGAGAAAATA